MLRKLLGSRSGSGDPIETAFGVLERDVLRVLWGEGDLAVRDVQARLSRPAAYTTVMTTLDRLFKKGVLRRRQDSRAFLYAAALSAPSMTIGSVIRSAVGHGDDQQLDHGDQRATNPLERCATGESRGLSAGRTPAPG